MFTLSAIFLVLISIIISIKFTKNVIYSFLYGNILLFSLIIYISGLLSFINKLNNGLFWSCISLFLFISIIFIEKIKIKNTFIDFLNFLYKNFQFNYFKRLNLLEKITISYLFITIIYQTIKAILLPVNHWDSYSYILPRVLLYIQQGHLWNFETFYPAQIEHVTGWAQIQIFFYLAFLRWDRIFGLLNVYFFVSTIISIWGITSLFTDKKIAKLIAITVFTTSVNVLNMATTAQSDVPIYFFLSIAIYAGFHIINQLKNNISPKNTEFLILFLSLGLMLTMKASALLILLSIIPILLLITLELCKKISEIKKLFKVLLFSNILFILMLFVGGYWKNYIEFGHPLGSVEWRRAHELHDLNIREHFLEGGKNALRYLINFSSFDGLNTSYLSINIFSNLQLAIREIVKKFDKIIGIDLENPNHSRISFNYHASPTSNADLSYPGFFFFISIMFSIFIFTKNKNKNGYLLVLLFCIIIYFLSQSFFGKYDPWRGRSFSNIVILASPFIGIILSNSAFLFLKLFFILSFFQGIHCQFLDSTVKLKFTDFLIWKEKYPDYLSDKMFRFSGNSTDIVNIKISYQNFLNLLNNHDEIIIDGKKDFLLFPFIRNFKSIKYSNNYNDIKNQNVIILSDKLKNDLLNYLFPLGPSLFAYSINFNKTITYPSPFFGIIHDEGILPIEIFKNNLFRLVTSENALIFAKKLNNNSFLRFTLSNIAVPNKLTIYVDDKIISKLYFYNKGKDYTFDIPIETENNLIQIKLKYENFFDDKSNNRKLYSIIREVQLLPIF